MSKKNKLKLKIRQSIYPFPVFNLQLYFFSNRIFPKALELRKYFWNITANDAKKYWNEYEIYGMDEEGHESLIQSKDDLKIDWLMYVVEKPKK